jgi:hypothetical protein
MPVTCPCGQRLQTSENAAETYLTCPDCGWSLIVSARDAALSAPGSGLDDDPLGGPAADVRGRRSGVAAAKLIPRLGAVAAALGLIAAMAHQASYPVWGAALAGLGLTLAGAGVLIAHHQGLAAGIPLVSALYCGTIAALALAPWPAVARRLESRSASLDPRPIPAGQRPVGAEDQTGEGTSLDPRPIPAGQRLRRGDAQIRLISAEVARPRIRELYFSEPTQWKEAGLLLTLEISNVGTSRGFAYEPHRCRIVDNLGNTFEEMDMGTASLADRRLGDHRLDPGQSLSDLLFFEPPPDRIAYLDLVIPGAVLGQTDPFQLRIPAGVIRR